MIHHRRILITGIGGPAGRSAVTYFKAKAFPVIGADNRGIKSPADTFYLIPTAGDTNYSAVLMDIIRKERPSLLIPAVTEELPVISQMKRDIEGEGCTVFISSPVAVDIANDKLKTSIEPVDDGDTDSDSFDTIYGNGDSLLTEFHFPVIDFTGSLANTGEVLILYGPGGGVVDLYDYTPFVRSNADGGRFSVERIDPMLPSGDANFRVSETSGGTPGMWNSAAGTISSGDVTPVPEPSTWILLATGLFLNIWRREPIITKKQKL